VQDLEDPDSGSTISLWRTEDALRAYENSDLLKEVITAKLSPFFSGQYETRRSRVRFAEGSPAPDEWLNVGFNDD
jgi:heme-degrading monooxygenase HmoA